MGLFGSLSWALAQRQLWIGRANNAWGSSRVWNSGSSFETDSATWQSRANGAYDSGTWGVGNTWQADYTAALAAALNQTSGTLSTTTPTGSSVWSGSSLTCPLTGHYVARWRHSPNAGNTGTFNLSPRLAGSALDTFAYACANPNQTTYAGAVEFDATAGQAFDLFCNSFSGSNGSSSSGSVTITFIPTPARPH